MKTIIQVKKNAYYDSVTLMLVSKEAKSIRGVKEALVGMGTDLNKELAENLGLVHPEFKNIQPNDLFIVLLAEEDEAIEAAAIKIEELLSKKKELISGDYIPPTLNSAIKSLPDANLVLISLPGRYVFHEAKKALEKGLHVMIFSDNVSLEEERILKELARERGLLVMGPDCGTAIINQTPLGFANAVRKGNIGIVGASGTGIQEVSVIIDKLGSGISQVIGTGGRDLKEEIGGIMMIEGIKALSQDSQTEVIVLISKPPSEDIGEAVLQVAREGGKPFVVNFIGGSTELIRKYGGIPCETLEDTARSGVHLFRHFTPSNDIDSEVCESELKELAEREAIKLKEKQRYIRGLYTGGTLCVEAMLILSKYQQEIYSNISMRNVKKLGSVKVSEGHSCIDLGDDVFTVGRAHPMIDPTLRNERFVQEASDSNVAVILLDFVLGFGSHLDPVGEMLPYIGRVKDELRKQDREVLMVASVCGTEGDPQNLHQQEDKLREAGVLVMASNSQAAKLAAKIISVSQKGVV